MLLLTTTRDAFLAPLQSVIGNRCRSLPSFCHGLLNSGTHIRNETNLTGGENVGGKTAVPTAPDAASDDDGGGDPDPEPERRHPRTRKTRNTSTAGSPAAPRAHVPGALQNFDALPDAAHVRLPVVCGLFACSPATAWRRAKAGTLPAPVKLSDRVTAWRVGDLRAALADIRA
ncbi:helix-turn-helix transcriptional regulator [Aromatoleum bremense]|uniref:helix-turn-helix transcriptional regulator n=1 Tax=Aromatoleum bremense TaxID=76115 RepID=UPI001B7CF928|nr:hypothetical protein [Aromatoleum bremense]